jgi:hypothetical protein
MVGVISGSAFPALVALALLGTSAAAAPDAPAKVDCGGGLELRIDAPAPAQGRIVRVEVVGATTGSEVHATWDGKPLPLWPREGEGPRRALLGIDLERAQGPVPLALQRTGGSPCTVTLEVKEGDFAVRRLTVAKRYVEVAPKDRARAEREAKQLEALFATVTPDRLWSDDFRLPVSGVESARNFGQKRVLNGKPRSPHAGVDFPAPPGAPVLAPQRGRVVLASSLFFSGRTVVLDHGLGLLTLYAHLSAVAVGLGDVVEAGARIGEVGATGRATGPHLHWSARLGTARVDPLDLLAPRD